MAIAFRPVQWNRNKLVYDIVLAAAITAYLLSVHPSCTLLARCQADRRQ